MTLEQIVRRITTEPAFAAAFRADPEATLRREGVSLEPEEVRALSAAVQDTKEPKAGFPWYESQLERGKPQAGFPWYEGQLGVRPT